MSWATREWCRVIENSGGTMSTVQLVEWLYIPMKFCRRFFTWVTITGGLFMCMQTHARPIVVLSPSWSPYCGIVLYNQSSHIYILTSEHIYRGFSRSAIESTHIYSIYHRLMHVRSLTELYHGPLVGYPLAKHDISNFRRRIAAVSLFEDLLTSKQRWTVCAGGGDSCVAICK